MLIDYDKIHGTPIPDGRAVELAELLYPDGALCTSSEILVVAVHNGIKTVKFDPEKITFAFREEIVPADKYGRIEVWRAWVDFLSSR